MRTLVVASGKGGTGKTTVTSVLVRLASRERRLVVADCDVEASNLPLALGAEVASRTAFSGGSRAVVDEDLCGGCDVCLDRCRFGALSISDDDVAVIDPWLCESCGACAQACPMGAIGFEAQQGGELMEGESPCGPIVFGRLRPGEEHSGKLATSVRERAGEIAAERGVALLLVDGPPGVGCPAIASITGAHGVLAVTEPTLSGEHDLRRLVTLARQLGVPVKVVLNKADLSASGAARIRAACRDLDLELVGEVLFDPELLPAIEAASGADASLARLDALDSVRSIAGIWARLEPWLSDGDPAWR